jgi:hypothetical protein
MQQTADGTTYVRDQHAPLTLWTVRSAQTLTTTTSVQDVAIVHPCPVYQLIASRIQYLYCSEQTVCTTPYAAHPL